MIHNVTDEDFGRLVHMRVEVQHLIRTYVLPLSGVATFEPWRRERAVAVLSELPDDIAAYKGIIAYRDRAVAWLRGAG